MNERLGISKDLINISDYVYTYIINNSNKDNLIIDGNDIKTEKIIIDKIYINKSKIDDIAEFNVYKSKITLFKGCKHFPHINIWHNPDICPKRQRARKSLI